MESMFSVGGGLVRQAQRQQDEITRARIAALQAQGYPVYGAERYGLPTYGQMMQSAQAGGMVTGPLQAQSALLAQLERIDPTLQAQAWRAQQEAALQNDYAQRQAALQARMRQLGRGGSTAETGELARLDEQRARDLAQLRYQAALMQQAGEQWRIGEMGRIYSRFMPSGSYTPFGATSPARSSTIENLNVPPTGFIRSGAVPQYDRAMLERRLSQEELNRYLQNELQRRRLLEQLRSAGPGTLS